MENQAQQEMKKWQSHKIVHAEKIEKIVRNNEDKPNEETDGTATLYFTESGGSIKVSPDYMTKHKPEVGGYYVVYDDGYVSWSPAKAFEEGYTRI